MAEVWWQFVEDEEAAGDAVFAGGQILHELARGRVESWVALVGVDPDVGVEVDEHQSTGVSASRSWRRKVTGPPTSA